MARSDGQKRSSSAAEHMMDVPAPLRAVNSKLEMYMVAKAKDRWKNILSLSQHRFADKILNGKCLLQIAIHRLFNKIM